MTLFTTIYQIILKFSERSNYWYLSVFYDSKHLHRLVVDTNKNPMKTKHTSKRERERERERGGERERERQRERERENG